MKALQQLRRFILAKSNSEEQQEIREYVHENLAELAVAFEVPPSRIVTAIEDVPDDASLACRLLETVRSAEAKQRDGRKEARAKAAQASADALASMARWTGDPAHLDLDSLLASVLTRRTDLLVFTSDNFTIGVYMAPLFDLAKLKKRNLTAFIDAQGLHIRWGTGGLNLRSREDRDAERIVMSLPSKVAAVAA